ncbi:hypothetical protein TsFJ059_004697 [Trichoderma semiorbis]|uniref:Uncharacterized protein n=1 Tax=Trichoderma semiorbis TaxID=1491008 RepID=A0A9P8KVG9_9HYPO|nr:hypothetical protein TsFJ059_004697 [Trichoderma semiorbis]
MPAIHALDDYYLAITALITVGYQLFFFAIAYTCNFDKLTDFAGGSNFIILAITTLSLNHHPQARQLVTTLLLIAWAIRLTASLLFRIPPQLYEKMPTVLKRTIFLEFPMYVFDPKKHSDMSQPGGAADEGDVGLEGDDEGSTPQSSEERLI